MIKNNFAATVLSCLGRGSQSTVLSNYSNVMYAMIFEVRTFGYASSANDDSIRSEVNSTYRMFWTLHNNANLE